jgi:hypothetical protein
MSGPQFKTGSATTIGNWILENSFSLPAAIELKSRRRLSLGRAPPKNDSVWQAAERKGFEVTVYDRNVANHEKKIDTDIVATMIEDSYELLKIGEDEVTLVSGDADYVPAIEKLKKRGIPVHVVFWGHASRELKDVATKFVNLDPFLEHLSR